MRFPLARALLVLGLAILVFSVLAWSVLGANTAWTKTYIEIPRTDEITGIAYTEKIKRFVPGVDAIIPALGVGFLCIFSGLIIFRRNPKSIL